MKILLGLLGSVVITATPATLLVNNFVSVTPRFDPIDEVEVSDEMKSVLAELNAINTNTGSFNDDNYLIKTLYQSTLMASEATNKQIYYNLLDKTREIVNKNEIKKRLDIYDLGEKPFTIQIQERLNDVSRENQIKMDDVVLEAYKNYQNISDKLSKNYFELYDTTITKLAVDIVNTQTKISKINVRNAEIQEKLKGIANENKIIADIINLLDVTLKFIEITRNIFNSAIGVVQNNYSSAKWHADNWGLGFIPFYGVGFNMTFQYRMNDTINGTKVYLKTFQEKDQSVEGTKALTEMLENLERMSEKINEVDPTNKDLISSLLEDAGANNLMAGLVQKGVEAGIDGLKTVLPVVGAGIQVIVDAILSGFNSKRIASNFNSELRKPIPDFIEKTSDVRDPLYDGLKAVNNVQANLRTKLVANNEVTAKLAQELNQNKTELDKLNKESQKLKEKNDKINNTVKNAISKGLSTNNLFYWYSNKIADIDFVKTNNLLLSKNESLKNLMKQKEAALIILKNKMGSISSQDPMIVENYLLKESENTIILKEIVNDFIKEIGE